MFKKKNPDAPEKGQPGNGEVKDSNPEQEQDQGDQQPTPQQLSDMLPPLRLFKVTRTNVPASEPTIVEAHGVETNPAGGLEFVETVVLQALNGQYGFAKRYRRVVAGGTWTDVEEVFMPTTVPLTRGSSLIQH